MPDFDNAPSQDIAKGSLLSELYDPAQPGIFQLQGFADQSLAAAPPGSIDLGVGMYPPGMCGSSAFDDALRMLGEDPATFMMNPTPDEILAALSVLPQPQSQAIDPPPSIGSISTDPVQTFNIDDYLQDFGASVSQEPTNSTTITQPPVEDQNSSATSSPHSGRVASPMPSFYATTPSPTSKQPYVPPRGAANTGSRRVGGTWNPISRMTSPIPSSTASPKRAAALSAHQAT
jgi:hypothetical protein